MRSTTCRVAVLVTLALLAVASCSGQSGQNSTNALTEAAPAVSSVNGTPLPTAARSLDLSSPTAGARAFIDLFESADFVGALQLLDVDAQRTVATTLLGNLTFAGLVAPAAESIALSAIDVAGDDAQTGAVIWEAGLRAAAEVGGLRINLMGGVTDLTLGSEQSGRATVTGKLADATEVIFSMSRTASGAWRVSQISLPGGDGNVPFSAHGDASTPPVPIAELVSLRDTLPTATPEDVVQTAIDLVEHDDFVSLFFVLHRDAQQAATRKLNNLDGQGVIDSLASAAWSETFTIANDDFYPLEPVFLFADFMEAVDAGGANPIDFGGDVSIGQSSDIQLADGSDAVRVPVTSSQTGATTYFVTEQVNDGRWRILQIQPGGSRGDNLPFAQPA